MAKTFDTTRMLVDLKSVEDLGSGFDKDTGRLFLDTSEISQSKGKKGQGKSLDLSVSDGDVIRGHQGGDPVNLPDNKKPDIVGDRGGGPPLGRGPSADHGGGEPTETAGNNLSFPVIWAENGSGLTVPGSAGTFEFRTPFDVNGDGLITSADQVDGYYQFAQKTAGNLWQAESVAASAPVYVTDIDWGDSLESIDMKVGRPIRVELSLYKDLGTTYTGEARLPDQMLSFPMTMLANPSSPDEVQGAGAATYPINGTALPDSSVHTEMITEATVYSAGARLIIQKLDGSRNDVAEGDLLWNGSQWVDANFSDPTGINDPLTGITFAGELNVGGKVIYGLSEGGWNPTEVGDYRITFYIDPMANAQLDHAGIRLAAEEEVTAIASEEGSDIGGGNGFVLSGYDPTSGIDRNLTYIDISVVTGAGGSGGGNGRPNDSLSGTSLDFNAIAAEISGLTATNNDVFL